MALQFQRQQFQTKLVSYYLFFTGNWLLEITYILIIWFYPFDDKEICTCINYDHSFYDLSYMEEKTVILQKFNFRHQGFACILQIRKLYTGEGKNFKMATLLKVAAIKQKF